MRELVQERLGAVEPLVLRRRVAEEVRLVVRDAADVLHRARVELGHEDLVVLGERVRLVEELGVEVEALARDLEDLGGLLVEVALHRAAREQAEVELAVLHPADDVRAADERDQVGAEELGLLEAVGVAAITGRLTSRLRGRWR